MSVFSQFPHRLKSKSTIEPIIDECLSFSLSLSRWNRVTKRRRRTKRVSNPYSKEGFAPAFVSLSLRVKFTREGEREGYQDENVRWNEKVISIEQREKERDIERRHRGLAVSFGSRRAWKRIAALPFAFLRVSQRSVQFLLTVYTYPSAVHLVQRSRQLPSRRMQDSWGSASKTSKDSEESLLRPADLKT